MEPKPLTPEEIEINQALYLAWREAALTATEWTADRQDSDEEEGCRVGLFYGTKKPRCGGRGSKLKKDSIILLRLTTLRAVT